MKRNIVHIDSEKCNGCGACVHACHENAIVLENGKARLIRDDYCDGLGDCLPACPADAISIIEREAAAYDEAAAQTRQAETASHGCPGMRAMALHPEVPAAASAEQTSPSQLRQWPVQIKLVPIHAPYFQGSKLLIAADCTAYAFASFHERFMKGRVTLVGCPKLDGVDYAEKLVEIIKSNDIQSVTVVRMEVPCCGGLEQAVKNALMGSGKFLPWQVVVLSTDGHILSE